MCTMCAPRDQENPEWTSGSSAVQLNRLPHFDGRKAVRGMSDHGMQTRREIAGCHWSSGVKRDLHETVSGKVRSASTRAPCWFVRTGAAPHGEPADARIRRDVDRERCRSVVQASTPVRCTWRCLALLNANVFHRNAIDRRSHRDNPEHHQLYDRQQ
jgi:hypothetical protein